jgi:hypothetical protein
MKTRIQNTSNYKELKVKTEQNTTKILGHLVNAYLPIGRDFITVIKKHCASVLAHNNISDAVTGH